MISSKRTKELRAIVESEGFKLLQVIQRNNGHLHITISNNAGELRNLTASATPSDRRANLNFRSDVRRVFHV